MSKKDLYTTPKMERDALKKELDDLTIQHQKMSSNLRERAVKMELSEISFEKNKITELKKRMTKTEDRIKELAPNLFDET